MLAYVIQFTGDNVATPPSVYLDKGAADASWRAELQELHDVWDGLWDSDESSIGMSLDEAYDSVFVRNYYNDQHLQRWTVEIKAPALVEL